MSMSMTGRGPRPAERARLPGLLREQFGWLGDRTDSFQTADMTGWWRSPEVLSALGAGLGELFAEASPTVIVGPESRGSLLGALTAQALSLGFVEERKSSQSAADSDAWLVRTSPPDYRDRHVSFAFRRRLLQAGDRVVMADDWVETGATARTVRALVQDAGAHWLGVAAIVDGLASSSARRELSVRSLLHVRDLR